METIKTTPASAAETTIRRARNDVILNHALKYGSMAGMNELEIFERLVHVLLDLNDQAMQEKLDALMKSALLPDMIGEAYKETK